MHIFDTLGRSSPGAWHDLRRAPGKRRVQVEEALRRGRQRSCPCPVLEHPSLMGSGWGCWPLGIGEGLGLWVKTLLFRVGVCLPSSVVCLDTAGSRVIWGVPKTPLRAPRK